MILDDTVHLLIHKPLDIVEDRLVGEFCHKSAVIYYRIIPSRATPVVHRELYVLLNPSKPRLIFLAHVNRGFAARSEVVHEVRLEDVGVGRMLRA